MENRENFHHDDLLDRAVRAVLSNPIPDDLPPNRIEQLVAAVRQAADQPHPITIIERIKNMRPRTRIAVAATVLIAFLGLMSWLMLGSGVSVAFADVAEALTNVRTATWKTTAVVTFKEPQKTTVTYNQVGMFLAPSREREETTTSEGDQSMKSIGITDGQKDKSLTLNLAKKTATITEFKNLPGGKSPFGSTFQNMRALIVDAQNGKGGKVERLGVETIDGRPVEGFRIIKLGVIEMKIWADPKTLLPIRVEQSSETPGGPEVRIVMTDFQVNVDLDGSLFSLDVPEGYAVQPTKQVDFSPTNPPKNPLAPLTDVLKMAAEYNDGVFPPTLRGEQGFDGLIQRIAKKWEEKHKGSPDSMMQWTQVGIKVDGFLRFLNALPPEAYHYAGKDVKLDTPNKPILWIQRKSDGQCTVFYADLSIKEDVPKEEAPKVPESEGSPKP